MNKKAKASEKMETDIAKRNRGGFHKLTDDDVQSSQVVKCKTGSIPEFNDEVIIHELETIETVEHSLEILDKTMKRKIREFNEGKIHSRDSLNETLKNIDLHKRHYEQKLAWLSGEEENTDTVV